MSTAMIDELARARAGKPCCHQVGLSVLLRLTSHLYPVHDHLVLEAELHTQTVATLLQHQIHRLGHTTTLHTLRPTTETRHPRYVLRVARGGAALAHQAGLLDRHGRLLRGFPRHVVLHGGVCDADTTWRTALLARGNHHHHTRSPRLTVACPTPETALALVGAARTLGIRAKCTQLDGVDQAVITDPDAIRTLLTRLGVAEYDVTSHTQPSPPVAARRSPPGLAGSNQHRSRHAAQITAARITHALHLLGPTTPQHLADTGRLRLTHPDLTLDELGQRHTPPVGKNTVAGRIRRLLTLADNHAHHHNLPDTTTTIPTPQ